MKRRSWWKARVMRGTANEAWLVRGSFVVENLRISRLSKRRIDDDKRVDL